MHRLLTPEELYPAGVPDIAVTLITLTSGIAMRVADHAPAPTSGGVKPPVVLLHGWGGCLFMYRHAFERLPRRGLRTIAVDLRGFGLSDKPRHPGAYAMDAYRADLDALLDTLRLDRVTLVGQSMGGGLALRYALARPERVHRLVLINPSGLVPVSYQRIARHAPRTVVEALGRRLVPRWVVRFILRHIAYGDASNVTERIIDEYWAPTQLPGFLFAARATLVEFDWRPLSSDDAARLTVPTTVILGDHDRVIGDYRLAAKAAGRIPGGRVQCLGGGHTVNEERPDEVYEIIAGDA